MRSGADFNPDIEYFQQLADGAPVMIWMSGPDMGCFYFNRAWLDFRGRTLQEEFGNGWADGVHEEDLERCIQHYASSFERREAFAMSYRLKHHSGEFRWILDRGSPHFTADGEFLGFFGGCAESPSEVAVSRISELRHALNETRHFAEQVAAQEALALRADRPDPIAGLPSEDISLERRARQHAAVQLGNLAGDMLRFDRIENGACLR